MVAVTERSGCPLLRTTTCAVLLGVFPLPCYSCTAHDGRPGSDVPKLIFENKCEKAVILQGWNKQVEAGQILELQQGETRPPTIYSNRIAWCYVDATESQCGNFADFIELNTNWDGPGECWSDAGHPSYSTYMGFNMPSKYEALKPDSEELACADAGAAVTYKPENCPTGPSSGEYLCDGTKDPKPNYGPMCDSPMAQYILQNSWAINSDGSWSQTFKGSPPSGGNYVNFQCSEINGLKDLPMFGHIASMVDCVDNSIPFVFKVTTCIDGPQLDEEMLV